MAASIPAITGVAFIVAASTPLVKLDAQSALPPNPQMTCTVPAATFASWFESGAPSLNGVVKPADSVLFSDIPNCDFYEWTWQMFLWLTSPAPSSYGGGAHIFDSPTFFDVSPPDASGERTFIPHVRGKLRDFSVRFAQKGSHGFPVVMSKNGKMLAVEIPRIGPKGGPLVLNNLGKTIEVGRITVSKSRKVVLADKAGKPILKAKPIIRRQTNKTSTVQKFMIGRKPIFLNALGEIVDVEQGQAGGGDVLMAQNGSLVYYSTMVNDVYVYFLTGTKNGAITPTPTRFPTTQADLDKIVAFAASHGKTFPDPEALAIEVKAAWVRADGLPNVGDYITMRATVPTYDTSDPNQWVPLGEETVNLALVGMHVVGSAKGHPEMIWGTFEHFRSAPAATYQYNSTMGPNPKTVMSNTSGDWVFCANGSAGPFNQAHMFFSSPNIVSTPSNTISPSDTMRMKAWGGAFNQRPNPIPPSTAASNTEVISINKSVLTQIIPGDIRANYFMSGSTWTIGGAAPTGSFNAGNEVGTSKMANTTMETYQQGINNLFATGSNCFSCHVTNTVSVSHIFGPTQPLFPPAP